MFFKNYKLGKWLFQLILLGLVCYFFYQQLSKISISSFSEINLVAPLALVGAILLVCVNWYTEFLKWRLSVKLVHRESSRSIQFKSFMAGVLSGFLTPNLLGNFVGRMYYFKRVHRSSIILLSLLANSAQFLASMLFGLVSIFVLEFPFQIPHIWILGIQLFAVVMLFFATVYYFFFEYYYPTYLRRKKWFGIFLQRLKIAPFLRAKLLSLSLFRHFIFSLQYVLVLYAFGFEFQVEVFVLIWSVFFWSTLIPSLWFGKLLIRESVAIWVFTLNGYTGEVVLLASVIIWLVNQGLIALVSIPFLKWKHDV